MGVIIFNSGLSFVRLLACVLVHYVFCLSISFARALLVGCAFVVVRMCMLCL